MGFDFSQQDIAVSNPVSAGSSFRFSYQATNNGPDDAGHDDHVQMWGSDGTVVLDEQHTAPASQTGGLYGVFVDVHALHPGYYDVAITLGDGTAAGTTVIVQ
jgi:hypothetical protein